VSAANASRVSWNGLFLVLEASDIMKNIGDMDLQSIRAFRAPRYEEISLFGWLTHAPPALVAF